MKVGICRLTLSAILSLLTPATFAATVQLQGLLDPNDTAVVSNPSLSGSTYSFSIQNTVETGVIANLGVSFGNTLRLSSFITSAPFLYTIQNNTIAPDFNLPLDFAMVGMDQAMGIAPGASETYTWMLTFADGTPVSGISAMDIAEHQVVRFRLVPTASGTDAAVGPQVVPEPAIGPVVGIVLVVLIRCRFHRTAA